MNLRHDPYPKKYGRRAPYNPHGERNPNLRPKPPGVPTGAQISASLGIPVPPDPRPTPPSVPRPSRPPRPRPSPPGVPTAAQISESFGITAPGSARASCPEPCSWRSDLNCCQGPGQKTCKCAAKSKPKRVGSRSYAGAGCTTNADCPGQNCTCVDGKCTTQDPLGCMPDITSRPTATQISESFGLAAAPRGGTEYSRCIEVCRNFGTGLQQCRDHCRGRR